MSTAPQSQWPKPYLLKVMEQAVKEGCLRLSFRKEYGAAAERMALSFQGAINRIRRRSDAQHRSFIIPEYHLITTTWEPDRGTLLVTYSSLPDGVSLPAIESLSDEEKSQLYVPAKVEPVPTFGAISEAVPFDPEKLIDDLLANVKP